MIPPENAQTKRACRQHARQRQTPSWCLFQNNVCGGETRASARKAPASAGNCAKSIADAKPPCQAQRMRMVTGWCLRIFEICRCNKRNLHRGLLQMYCYRHWRENNHCRRLHSIRHQKASRPKAAKMFCGGKMALHFQQKREHLQAILPRDVHFDERTLTFLHRIDNIDLRNSASGRTARVRTIIRCKR